MAGYLGLKSKQPSVDFRVEADQIDPSDLDLKAEGQDEPPEDSLDFSVQPESGEDAVPVDLELVLLNDVSGSVADTDDRSSENLKTKDGSGIALETHINATWTMNDPVCPLSDNLGQLACGANGEFRPSGF